MNLKNESKGSGNYVNGVYTSKNGFAGTGLNCPKGTRLYNNNCPIFFEPEDTQPGEHFEMITPEVAPDILPYYAISNYGRVLNINSGNYMKPNYRPNGYEYLCLAADNCKNGQKKYSTHRLVMKTFDPVDNMDNLQVNHKDSVKSHNYINKVMPDGSIESNLEWSTPKENTIHRSEQPYYATNKLSKDDADRIRKLHDEGWSYNQIVNNYYPYISCNSIQLICRNKVYIDPNYTPKDYSEIKNLNPGNVHKITLDDATRIRNLYNSGMSAKDIHRYAYSDFSYSTILDIVNGVSHNN